MQVGTRLSNEHTRTTAVVLPLSSRDSYGGMVGAGALAGRGRIVDVTARAAFIR